MMESADFPSSQNGENKWLSLKPEFKITYLQKVQGPRITKSPSWPNSPIISRSDMSQGLDLPTYMTLGRKGFTKKISDEEFGITEDLGLTKRSSDPQVEEIRSMLSSLDLSKYRRKSKDPLGAIPDKNSSLIRRSISHQPQINTSYLNGNKKSFLDDIPPPPKTTSILNSFSSLNPEKEKSQKTFSLELTPINRNSRPVNSKLKELTEKLRPSSAPPSPHRKQKLHIPYTAPPLSNFSFWNDPLPDFQETNTDNPKEDAENRCDAKELLKNLKVAPCNRREKLSELTKALKNSGYATLPRTKPVLNKSKSVEPRTLACLDLNTSLDSLRNNENVEEKYELKQEDTNFLKKEDKSNASSEFHWNKFHRNPLLRQEECENEGDIIPTTKRNNSFKKKREEFDLNFSKYGSLTHPQEKRDERRKSLPKIEKIDKIENSDVRISSPDHSSELESNTPDVPKLEDENDKNTFPNDKEQTDETNYVKTNNSSSEVETEKKDNQQAPQSAPVSSLEEEIRTIAKLLDGKESLFLKLIQSSNVVKDTKKPDNINFESERSFSPTGGELELSNVSSDIPKSISDLRSSNDSTGRSSPSRLRAMTVPATSESNRNQPISNIASPPPQKRYFKKRLRGPYGEMLEQEMSKSMNKSRQSKSYAKDLDFLKELENLDLKNKASDKGPNRSRTLLRSSSHSFDETHSITVDGMPKRKTSANIPIVNPGKTDELEVPTTSSTTSVSEPILHIRSHSDSVKTSSSWNVEQIISGILKQPHQQVGFLSYFSFSISK